MSVYTPGALGAIFTKSNSSDNVDTDKASKKLLKLFSKKNITKSSTPELPKKQNKLEDKVEDKTDLVKNAQSVETGIKSDSSNILRNEGPHNTIGPTVIPEKQEVSASKKRKKKDLNSTKDKNDTEGPPIYTQRSRKFQVRDEDTKIQNFDAEKESRTVFVGNLPTDVTGKVLKRRVSNSGVASPAQQGGNTPLSDYLS